MVVRGVLEREVKGCWFYSFGKGSEMILGVRGANSIFRIMILLVIWVAVLRRPRCFQ